MTFARTLFVLVTLASSLDAQRRPPLDSAAIGDIAKLLLLEDVRRFDAPELTRLLESTHPEVRRRAMLSVARIRDPRGVALLRARPLDADTALAATTVFAVGQLRDTLTIAWFDSLLSNPQTSPSVAVEAACALGKIKTVAARDVLARYLRRPRLAPMQTQRSAKRCFRSDAQQRAVTSRRSSNGRRRWTRRFAGAPHGRSSDRETRRPSPRCCD
jgi:HEAT repeat protein